MYLGDVEPSLRAGMDFLAGPEGPPIGCLTNRYMTVLDPGGAPIAKTFGMSWWRSLADLERWAQSHPTHVAIFGAAMKYLQTMGPTANLKLYHEVSVATAEQQRFEYRRCHPGTGMLAVAKSEVAS
jgi:aldoxime dehydratase